MFLYPTGWMAEESGFSFQHGCNQNLTFQTPSQMISFPLARQVEANSQSSHRSPYQRSGLSTPKQTCLPTIMSAKCAAGCTFCKLFQWIRQHILLKTVTLRALSNTRAATSDECYIVLPGLRLYVTRCGQEIPGRDTLEPYKRKRKYDHQI
ncbi:uncharacterized protein LOC111873361 [Cryptotermes secundus]|uniref:uncharacterized protein LOC111873361 n=1 Tax=Cryptotermes secundus TaxID=105785 RepID=UPI000CD7DEEA|nr:uncharacterized protein LOC111873361 [Cryptotermes secundus]